MSGTGGYILPPHIECKRRFTRIRDYVLEKGLEVDFGEGQIDTLQTRPQDHINLIAIQVKAQQLLGQPDAVIRIRAESDVTYNVSPEKAIELTNSAFAFVEGIYQQSWDLKDQIDAAVGQLTEVQQEDWDVIRQAIDHIVWPLPASE